MLEMAEYLVTAATVIVLFGVVSCFALVTRKHGAKVQTRTRALVAVGDGPAETIEAEASSAPEKRSSLGWWAAAFQITAEDFHERRFARAVGADQAITVAFAEPDRHVLE